MFGLVLMLGANFFVGGVAKSGIVVTFRISVSIVVVMAANGVADGMVDASVVVSGVMFSIGKEISVGLGVPFKVPW